MQKDTKRGQPTFQNLPHGRIINLAKPQTRQNLPIDMHKRAQRLARLLLLQPPREPRLRQLRAKHLVPRLRLLRVVRRVVALRRPEENPLLQVQLEDLAPHGEQLLVGAAVRVREVRDLLAELLDFAVHAALFALAEGFETGELRGQLGEEFDVRGEGDFDFAVARAGAGGGAAGGGGGGGGEGRGAGVVVWGKGASWVGGFSS